MECFFCLLIRAENPEIQPLHVIIQQISSTDGNDSVTRKSILDCAFFSFTTLVPKLFSYNVKK